MAISNYIKHLILFVFGAMTVLLGQAQSGFLGQWTGQEDLESESISYQNRNISLTISEGGVREGFYIFNSSCDFLYNENLEWAYHYFGFNKDDNRITFLRRFITPVGILGYEELVYDIIEWSDDSFVAQYSSPNRETSHQLRLNINYLNIFDPIPSSVTLGRNFPNPFNPKTTIEVSVDKISNGMLSIYDIKGSKVNTLFNDTFYPGKTSLSWDGRDHLGNQVASGTYIYSLIINGKLIGSQRMIFIK